VQFGHADNLAASIVTALALPTRLDESRRQRWEKVTDSPLTIAAVVILAAYATPIRLFGSGQSMAQHLRDGGVGYLGVLRSGLRRPAGSIA
jgi:hypothetical protein